MGSMNLGDQFLSLLMPTFGVIVIILLAYFGTKWFSKKYSRMSSGRYMQVLERMALGQDKSLALIKIGRKVYLFGVSAKGVDNLCTFDEGEISAEESSVQKNDFSSVLTELLKKQSFIGKNSKKQNDNKDEDDL